MQNLDLKKIRLGTRGSPLALVQAETVKREILRVCPDWGVEIVVMKTSGDWRPEHGEVALEESKGGKGLFAKELEEALLERRIDIAVHSMKDMEVNLPEGLEIPFMLPREDVHDAFISNNNQKIDDLPIGSVIGTVSARRAAFLLAKRPDLKIVPFRGNVQTRLDKLKAGNVDATILARAGLNRLNLTIEQACNIPVEDMLPSVGQGAVGIEIRSSDRVALSSISQISCLNTVMCVNLERAVLRGLGGTCKTPVGVYACGGDEVRLRVRLLSPDGMDEIGHYCVLSGADLQLLSEIGVRIGASLKERAPKGALGG